jgi:hypothetical protein
MDNGKVRFRWKDYRDVNRQKFMTLDANEFIGRFLIHVLPDGFHRTRTSASSAAAIVPKSGSSSICVLLGWADGQHACRQ